MDMARPIMAAQEKNVEAFRAALLAWYDRHRRVLPWRSLPGQTPDPYRVWLSEVMLQQTTVPAVMSYFRKFTELWPDVHSLANAPSEAVMENWAGLGYYARARNLHKCAKIVSEDHGGIFPETQEGLQNLPGIGGYTSAAIAAIAFNKPANVVDGNVERVMARMFAEETPLPDAKKLLACYAARMAEGEVARPGDYAQALMDLGATVCTPSSPKCMICPVLDFCEGRAKGIQETLPRKRQKADKPKKHGYVYWVSRNGRVLLERRPEKGLLGGMVGLPTSLWVDEAIEKTHLPLSLKPEAGHVLVKHSFTHFDLELHGIVSAYNENAPLDPRFFWVEREEAGKLGMPTVFKKALKQFI
jgi:A/G-specific adenine glycosylase